MEMTRRNALQGGSVVLGAGLFGGRSLAQSRLASLAYGPATGVYSLGPIADAKGFLKAEGLDFKLVVGNAGTHGRQSLAAGQALFAHGDASHPLQLSTRGKKAKIVLATQMIASIANIVVRKDLFDAGINTVEKLAHYKRPNGGKPIVAATAIGSGTWMYGTYMFESKGLGKTVNWVAGGGLKTMFAGLETQAVRCHHGGARRGSSRRSARASARPSSTRRSRASSLGAFGGTVPVLVIYTLEDTIEQNRSLVQSFVNGLYQGHALGEKNPGRRGPRPRRGTSTSPASDPTALKAEIGFDKATWDYTGRIDKASFERGGKVWYRDGTDIPEARFEDMVDMSFLDAAAGPLRMTARP